MPNSSAEQMILDRYIERCRVAGGLRAGFVLRRAALLYVQRDHPDLDLERAIGDLIERDILKASESGDFLFLTTSGVETIQQSSAGTEAGATTRSQPVS